MTTWLLSDDETKSSEKSSTETSTEDESGGFLGIDFGAGFSQLFGGLMSVPGLLFGSGSASSQAQGHAKDAEGAQDAPAAGGGGLVGSTAEGLTGAIGGASEGIMGLFSSLPALLGGGMGLFGGALSAFAGPAQAIIQKSAQRDVIKALTSRKALAAQERLKGLAFRQAFISAQIAEGDRLARGMEKITEKESRLRLVGVAGFVGILVVGGLVAWRLAK